MQKRIGLVRDLTDPENVIFDNLQEFEKAILEDADTVPIEHSRLGILTLGSFLKTARRIGRIVGLRGPYELPSFKRYRYRFCVILGMSVRRCADFAFAGRKAAFLFDPTEPWTTASEVARFVEDLGITDLFVGDPAFVPPIQEHTSRCRVHFLLEGIDPKVFRPRPVAEKDIAVFEFGRKMPGYHQALLAALERTPHRHEHTFVDEREKFVDYLGRARVTTCFPRAMTHQTMDIEFISARYLQGMVSKALVVGKAPPLLEELFGYNPIIKADFGDPVGQMLDILDNFDDYQPLIERNYQTICDGFTCRHRWQEVKRVLESS
jgi:hypothetical protein